MAVDQQDHGRDPEEGDDIDAVREKVKAQLNEEARRSIEIAEELWASGKMEAMIDNEDFSDLPDEVRPAGYNADDEDGDSDPYDPSEEFADE
jgi:hypothetical protein